MKNSFYFKTLLLGTTITCFMIPEKVMASDLINEYPVSVRESTQNFISKRPEPSKRLFHSEAVERKIQEVKTMLSNPYLKWMFENCFQMCCTSP